MKHIFKNQKRGEKVQVDFKENSNDHKNFKTYNFWPRPACLSAKRGERGQLSPQATSSSGPMIRPCRRMDEA